MGLFQNDRKCVLCVAKSTLELWAHHPINPRCSFGRSFEIVHIFMDMPALLLSTEDEVKEQSPKAIPLPLWGGHLLGDRRLHQCQMGGFDFISHRHDDGRYPCYSMV
jgi:hypothetical protein